MEVNLGKIENPLNLRIENVLILETRMFYRWNQWLLIRQMRSDYMFIWSDNIVLLLWYVKKVSGKIIAKNASLENNYGKKRMKIIKNTKN